MGIQSKKVFGVPRDKIRILIIEDNPVDRAILRHKLEEMGLDLILECSDGLQGLEKLANFEKAGTPVHLVITDWKMPRKDGFSVVSAIAKKRWAQPYTIMLTSVDEFESVKAVLGLGVDDYILKPTNLDLLKKKVLLIIDKLTSFEAA